MGSGCLFNRLFRSVKGERGETQCRFCSSFVCKTETVYRGRHAGIITRLILSFSLLLLVRYYNRLKMIKPDVTRAYIVERISASEARRHPGHP